jgi:hypothetical protein
MIIAVVTFPGFLGQYMSLSSASAIEDLGQPDMGNALLTKAKDWVDPNSTLSTNILLGLTFSPLFLSAL